MLSTELLIYSSAGGILPALLWLWLWLKADKDNPEPRKILALAFLGGMIAVIPAIILQMRVETLTETIWFQNLSQGSILFLILGSTIFIVAVYAGIEEVIKFGFCYVTALISKENDEPIDSIIYLITTALGFVAIENTLFITSAYLSSPIGKGLLASIVVGNIRFVGASLIHVASSAIIGVFLAMAFRKKLSTKILFAFYGVIVATALHAYFNFIIMKESDKFLLAFPMTWTVVVILILLLEKIKRIK